MITIISVWALISGIGSEMRGRRKRILPSFLIHNCQIWKTGESTKKLCFPFLIPVFCLLVSLGPGPSCSQSSSKLFPSSLKHCVFLITFPLTSKGLQLYYLFQLIYLLCARYWGESNGIKLLYKRMGMIDIL